MNFSSAKPFNPSFTFSGGNNMVSDKSILNLTQHAPTPEQIEAGVVEPNEPVKTQIKTLLTFSELPTPTLLHKRAYELAMLVKELEYKQALIGGAPYFMPHLEGALRRLGITPLYSFSIRESVEETLPDGSVKKTNVFKHVGFIEGNTPEYYSDLITGMYPCGYGRGLK